MMQESWISGLALAPFALALAAYLIGIATGWLIWGRLRPGGISGVVTERLKAFARDRQAQGDAAPDQPVAPFEAAQEELKSARALIEQSDKDDEALSEALAALDGAIKRANGRLTLIQRAVKKAAPNR